VANLSHLVKVGNHGNVIVEKQTLEQYNVPPHTAKAEAPQGLDSTQTGAYIGTRTMVVPNMRNERPHRPAEAGGGFVTTLPPPPDDWPEFDPTDILDMLANIDQPFSPPEEMAME